MSISEIIEKGSITIKKEGKNYVIVYSGYKEYGTLTEHKFIARNLKIAYDKLLEYLNYSN